jgi:hypothetical protein
VFSPNRCLFFTNLPSSRPIRAHTCSAITRRLCGWLGASGTQDLRALRLWQSCRQWRAQPWSCMDAAPGCLATRLHAALLSQHIDGVDRAGSAGTKSGSSARSLVLLTMLAPVVENRTVRGPARARRRSELANRGRLRHGQLSSPWRTLGLAVSRAIYVSFQRQRGPAGPRESMFCADGPRIITALKKGTRLPCNSDINQSLLVPKKTGHGRSYTPESSPSLMVRCVALLCILCR